MLTGEFAFEAAFVGEVEFPAALGVEEDAAVAGLEMLPGLEDGVAEEVEVAIRMSPRLQKRGPIEAP